MNYHPRLGPTAKAGSTRPARAAFTSVWLLAGLLVLVSFPVRAAEVIPPAPARYFNDFANVTKPGTADRLNQSLEQFEKETSSQIVVAVFPKMQSDSSVEDYVNRLFRAWKIGQKQKNNGVLLAVFVQDRKMRIEVGYGLEGAIPDIIAKRIIDGEITPRFKNGDFDGGLGAGVNALMQAARGEYKGSGTTIDLSKHRKSVVSTVFIFLGLILLVIRIFRKISMLGNFTAEEYLLFFFTISQRAEVGHAVLAYHRTGDLGRFFDIVRGPGRDLSDEKLFGNASAH